MNIEDYRDLSNLDGWRYTFVHDTGKTVCTYGEYLNNGVLRGMVNDGARYRLALGNVIFTYSTDYLAKKPDVVSMLRRLEEQKQENPLRFFAPSGQEALDFLNNDDDDVLMMTTANRFGKTQSAIIKLLINAMPCDPAWEIFTKYGVQWKPFRGPKKCGIASYSLDSHRATIVPMLLDWIPLSELGPYAKNYSGRGAKSVNVDTNPNLPLVCGTNISFFAMTHEQQKFESSVIEYWVWDEQGDKAKFLGANERSRTTLSHGRHWFALTPHKVDGRPDTGGGSWISKLWHGTETFGRSIKTYQPKVWDVPDWIYPEESKRQAFYQWIVEPSGGEDGKGPVNDKMLREGRSRFLGEWHESSGLVIDEWDSEVHLIDPFEIPNNWTRYRAVDHGIKHPCAAIWVAVSPAGDAFLYREYLQTGNVISKNAKEIVEASGNKLIVIGEHNNPKNGMIYTKHEEMFSNESYEYTVFDGRAFSQTDSSSGLSIASLYQLGGLKMVQGSGKDSDTSVPIMKEWFVKDYDKRHFVTGEKGAPRLYVFNDCKNFIRQIRGWVWQERKTRGTALVKESPSKVDDDLMDCLKILLQKGPRFTGRISMMDRTYYDHEMEDGGAVYTGVVLDKISGY